jgi:hypothetical protein
MPSDQRRCPSPGVYPANGVSGRLLAGCGYRLPVAESNGEGARILAWSRCTAVSLIPAVLPEGAFELVDIGLQAAGLRLQPEDLEDAGEIEAG